MAIFSKLPFLPSWDDGFGLGFGIHQNMADLGFLVSVTGFQLVVFLLELVIGDRVAFGIVLDIRADQHRILGKFGLL